VISTKKLKKRNHKYVILKQYEKTGRMPLIIQIEII